MKGFLIIFFTLLLTSMQFNASAQQPETPIRIKIDANVDGKQVNIDTNINALDDFNIDAFLKDLGIENELNQLNIDINSGFHFDWHEQAFDDMMGELRSIEMPEFKMEQLEDLKFITPNKAVLGVYTEKELDGARITGLVNGGAAANAGLIEGDIITGIDHRTIESPSNLSEVISLYEPGAKVKVTYFRDGKSATTDIVLKENTTKIDNWAVNIDSFNTKLENFNPEQLFEMNTPTRGFLGVYLDDENDKVVITSLSPDGPAAKAGLLEGDIIREVNGKKIGDYDELMDFMNGTVPGDKIKITYERNGKINKTEVELSEVKNRMNFFKNDDEGAAPRIQFEHAEPMPPGNAYSYSSVDGKRNVTIRITSIKENEAPKTNEKEPLNELHPLMEPRTLNVYSNPSDGTFNIKFNLNEAGDTKISVTDINGAIVYEETIKNFSGAYDKTVSLLDAPKGTYFVKVTQNGYSGTKTVILQ